MSRKRLSFKPGVVYVIDYDDHYSSSRVYEKEDARDTRCTLRAIGAFLHEDRKVVVLENQRTSSDRSPNNQRVDVHGVIKSCITRVRAVGKID